MSEPGQHATKAYVTLDSLLDTRLGALNLISTDFALDVMQNPAYYTRAEDHFGSDKMGYLANETYQQVYRENYANIVRASIKTRMIEFIEQLLQKLYVDAMTTPYHSAISLEINTWPFTLEAEEMNALQSVIAMALKGQHKVDVITKDPKFITAEYARDNYRAMVMYHYHDWLNHHNAQVMKKVLYDATGLYLPRIYQGYEITGEDLAEFEQYQTDPFTLTQRVLMPFVTIQWLPISLYCAAVPSNLTAYAQTA